ncbi:MAG TPA: hypothetical protein VJA21_02995 [Verrucomicrobiae bacterium]
MTAAEARQILLLYRPGTADAEDPEVVQAMAVAREDRELARWFENHCAFQKAMRAGFRQIQVPAHLKLSVLANARAIPSPAPSRTPVWLAAIAGILLLFGLAGLWLRPRAANNYQNFAGRMLTTALRPYQMDIQTNDMRQVRSYLASQGAPSDYELTRGLEKLPLTGAGALRWRSNPVSMVCFNRGDNEMLFLFVLKRTALKDPPPEQPQIARQRDCVTVRWSRGDKTYMLAGPEEANFVQKYL